MGGKHKQTQRTKQNTKPSSSGRTAERLGESLLQFESFAGIKESNFSLPGKDIENCLDSDFQLVFKKMNKKDPTTKLKALQQFAELVSDSEPEAVKAILSFWPRPYNILASDAEHHIREAAHNAHQKIVLKVKRELAPFLKQLIGPWFTSQYDTYAPAATAASRAFQDAFPQNKVQEVLLFCQEEILCYILENLTMQPLHTGNSKTPLSEEDQARYERILVSNLKGYSVYLHIVSEEMIKNACEQNNKIISNIKFWKLSKHKMTTVRAAWFQVLATLCQRAPFLLENHKPIVCSTVLGKLDENDPVVLSYIWEATLVIMTSIEDWSSYLDFEKSVLSKLWNVLRDGANGNASIVFPNLLPFISHLPANVNINTFYPCFFENFYIGLKQKNILTIKSDLTLAVTSLTECIKFAFFKNHNDFDFCENIIKSQIMPFLEWVLTDKQLNYKVVFTHVVSLLDYWSNNLDTYQQHLTVFWESLTCLFCDILIKMEDNINSISRRQVECLQYFGRKNKVRKPLKVQFQSSSSTDDSGSKDTVKSVELAAIETCLYLNSLNKCVYKICAAYIVTVDTKNCNDLLEIILSLLKDFETNELFKSLIEELKEKYEVSSLLSLHENVFWKWLNKTELDAKYVVDVIFYLFKYLKDEEKHRVLSSFNNEQLGIDCLNWCIRSALSSPYNLDPIVQKWLNQDKVRSFLLDILDTIIDGSALKENSDVFKLSFTTNQNECLLFDNVTVGTIIDRLKCPLLNPDDFNDTLDICASLASYIATVIYTDTLLLTHGKDLLLTLFDLSCKIDKSVDLSVETRCKVNNAWQNALIILSNNLSKEELFSTILNDIGYILERQFLSNELKSQAMITNITDLIRIIYKSAPIYVDDIMSLVFNREFISDYKNYITSVCLSAEYLRGHFSWPYEPISFNSNPEMDILKHFIWSDLRLDVLLNNLEIKTEKEIRDTDLDEEDDEDLIVDIVMPDLLISSLYDLGLASVFCDNYRTNKYYKNVNLYQNELKRKVTLIFAHKNKHLKAVTVAIDENIKKYGGVWCVTAYIFFTDIIKEDLSSVCEILLPEIQNKLSMLHFIQTFGKYISHDNLPLSLDTLEYIIAIRSLKHNSTLESILPKIEHLRSEDTCPFSSGQPEQTWKKTQEVIEVTRFLAELFRHNSKCLERNYWDFCLITLASWSKNLYRVKADYKKIEIQASITAIADLYISVEDYVLNLKQISPEHNFVNEWEELFRQSIHNDLFQLWLFLAKQFESDVDSRNFRYTPFLEDFGKIVNKCICSYVLKDTTGSFPDWSKLKRCCFNLLKNSDTCLQLWGYKMLLVLVPGLIETDLKTVEQQSPTDIGLIFAQFEPLLVEINDIVSTMLSGFKIGENTCRVEEITDSFTYTFAYLLLWDILLAFRENSPAELSYQYADVLKESDLLKNVLNNLFRLMPVEIVHCNENGEKLSCLFIEKANLGFGEPCTSEKIEEMVCWIYASILKELPALVRQWWSTVDVKVSQVIEKITVKYVSPSICAQELSAITDGEKNFKNMVIKVMPNVREVLAVYTVDEVQMELVITLPVNYPLGGPSVQCNRQIGGAAHKQWLMQLKKYLLHQNGHVSDALVLWNKTLNRKFDGVEECYICFAVLHPATYQMPKLSCQTCKKKFHSACLYRWFNTSNKSSCPICRNLF